ncbi:MAG: ATP-binding protein [Anaerolineae bacterium]
MSIRLRLTLWYTAVLASILLIFGVAIFQTFQSFLNRQVDRTLEEIALDLQSADTVMPPSFFLDERFSLSRLPAFGLSAVYVQVWDAQGELLAWSDNAAGRPFPLDPQMIAEKSRHRRLRDVVNEDPKVIEILRVLTVPRFATVNDGQPNGWFQIATSLEAIHNTRQELLYILVRGSIVGVLVSALMGALLAQRALSPIHAATQTAVQITRADDLGRRIPHLGPPDEVGQLVGAFNEMLERLERIFRAQQRFVADVSHELRTPLTTVRGNIDLLRRMGGADLASLNAIQDEADRMVRLVGDLLMLARADAGRLPIAHEIVEIDAVLVEVAQQARLLGGDRLYIDVECPPLDYGEPLTVLGDIDRLKQLLLNLSDNAIKHTPDGGRVSLCLAQSDGWVRLTVADTGTGIPPEDLPHIFDRFYRAEKSRWRKPATNQDSPGIGAGLGLSIARWIAEAHNGRIEVQSELGKGSAFHVWLPLAESNDR